MKFPLARKSLSTGRAMAGPARRARLAGAAAGAALLAVAGAGALALGQDNPAPAPPADPVAKLAQDLATGAAPLSGREDARGYLAELLRRLDIPEDSQVLVFSKTSLQARFIDPKSPRAIYFNDTVAVGTVPGAPLIEIMALGEDGKMRFYVAPSTPSPGAAPSAESGCVACHVTVESPAPVMLVGSVTPLPNGAVAGMAENTLIDARSPFKSRWGGWYVTGLHGAMKHRGNVVAQDFRDPRLDLERGQNVTDLSSFFDISRYLGQTSDIVALMTLEHQVGFAAIASRLHSQEDPDEIEQAILDLADYMVGADEETLSAPIEGVSSFSETFAKKGPRDSRGRSLRDFDLHSRLFRYPLSYMIYTPAFDALQPEAKAALYRRLVEILTGADDDPRYARFADGSGRAALEIVAATKPGLPEFWPRLSVASAK